MVDSKTGIPRRRHNLCRVVPHPSQLSRVGLRVAEIAEALGNIRDSGLIGARLLGITDQNRCFLGEEEQRVVASLLRSFPEDFTAELEGAPPLEPFPVPKIIDIHDGVAIYDDKQMHKQPDWTYAPGP